MADTGNPPGRTFVDSNVFVYSVDEADPDKRNRARAVLDELGASVVVSAQVLNEFYTVVTRKLEQPLSEEDAAGAVERLSTFPVVVLDEELTRQAIELSRSVRISIWDALVVRAAATAACERLLTEDLSDGQLIAGVRIENPFG